jgi:hypothetical protein
MEKHNKKIIILIVVTTLVVIIGVIFYLKLSSTKNHKYPEEPIIQSALGTGEDYTISLGGIEDYPTMDYKYWEISQKISKENIEQMIEDINPELKLTDMIEGEYYYWSDDNGNYFQYSLLKNILTFSLNEGIQWEEKELSQDSFTIFVKRYFNKNWEYEFNSKKNYPNSLTLYYANRLLPNDLVIETTELYKETDYLSMKDGKIFSGRILLTEFIDTQKYIPILDLENLSRYINSPQYPSSIYFNPGKISSALSIENEYLNDEISEIREEITNCNAVQNQIVYLYQSFEQKFLTPVFRLDLECSVEYENETYSVPGTAYVNAINPEYVSID